MLKPAAFLAFASFWFLMGSGALQCAEPPPVIGGAHARPKPQVPLHKPDILVEWQNILDDCSTEKICVQGGVLNQGPLTAFNVRLRVEIGSHNLSKPRLVKTFPVENVDMNAGDRQEYYFELERKTPYHDRHGKEKILEVGKYNFKVLPQWDEQKKPPKKKGTKR
jgi:hypothetical protein